MNSLGLVPTAFPLSHVLDKIPGDNLIVTWDVRNDDVVQRGAALEIEEIIGSTPQFRGGSSQVSVSPGQTVSIDASGPLSAAWTVGAQVVGRITMLGFDNFGDSQPSIIVAQHDFLITISDSGTGPVLVAVGDPVIS